MVYGYDFDIKQLSVVSTVIFARLPNILIVFDESNISIRQSIIEVNHSTMSCVLVLARFCSPSSELAIAERWHGRMALEDLLGVSAEKINDDRLYRAMDELLPHKDALCAHLQERYAQWFGTRFDFLFYDVTSTYFEGMCAGNAQARHGYGRDQRPDCVQV